MEYDQPFYTVTLLPVDRPTTAQIKLLRELGCWLAEDNLLKVRSVLVAGGYQMFGVLLVDEAAKLCKQLDEFGIPHRVDHLPTRRVPRL